MLRPNTQRRNIKYDDTTEPKWPKNVYNKLIIYLF